MPLCGYNSLEEVHTEEGRRTLQWWGFLRPVAVRSLMGGHLSHDCGHK